MTISVNFNSSATQTYDTLNQTNTEMVKTLRELSSGVAVSTAADNPAGFVTAGLLSDQALGDGTIIRNAQAALATLKTAASSIGQMSGIVDQIKQILYSSESSATVDAAQREANQQQLEALQQDFHQIRSTTPFGSQGMLGVYGSRYLYTGLLQMGTGTGPNSQQSYKIPDFGLYLLTFRPLSAATQKAATNSIKIIHNMQAVTRLWQDSIGAEQNKLQDIISNLTSQRQNLDGGHRFRPSINCSRLSTDPGADRGVHARPSQPVTQACAQSSRAVRSEPL